MNAADSHNSGRRLATVKEVANLPGYRCFTESALRHLVFCAQDRHGSNGELIPGNGLAEAGAILRIGRKIVIDIDRFDAWLDGHRAGAQTAVTSK